MQGVEAPIATTEEPVWRGRVKRALIVTAAVSPFVVALGLRLPVCPSATFLGVPCPGCGLTRATLTAFDGRLMDAFQLHPLFFFVTPLYVGFIVTAAWTYVRGPDPSRRPNPHLGKIIGAIMGLALVLMLAVWVARFFGWLGGPVPVERFRGF